MITILIRDHVSAPHNDVVTRTQAHIEKLREDRFQLTVATNYTHPEWPKEGHVTEGASNRWRASSIDQLVPLSAATFRGNLDIANFVRDAVFEAEDTHAENPSAEVNAKYVRWVIAGRPENFETNTLY
jgi:hypothetical protein